MIDTTRNEPTVFAVSPYMKVAAVVAFYCAGLVLSGCHRGTAIHWKPDPTVSWDDSTPGQSEVFLNSEVGELACWRLDTSSKGLSKRWVNLEQIPEYLANAATLHKARVLTNSKGLYCLTYTLTWDTKRDDVTMIVGRDRRFAYYAVLELKPPSSLKDAQAALADHFWGYDSQFNLANLKETKLSPRPTSLLTRHFGTLTLHPPWFDADENSSIPWETHFSGSMVMIECPPLRGFATLRERKTADVVPQFLRAGSPYQFKRTIGFGVREYENRDGRSAFEIRRAGWSLVFEEPSLELEIKFSNALRNLALTFAHTNKSTMFE